MTQTDRATGNQPESLGAAGVSTGPSMGPAIFCCSPRNSQRQFHNKRYRNSQWPCHRLRNRLCRSRNKRPARINHKQPGRAYASPAPTRIRQWPSRTNHQSRKSDFGRSSGRLTASQVIETCATILAGVIIPRSCMDQPANCVCPGGSYRRPVRSGRADCGCAFAASTPDAA